MSQKICVYAICKNELKFIDKWLENMSEADYIVILDTGSTDGTYEKLQQDPRVTRVEQEVITPWRFDMARNRSMDLIPDDADILVCTDFDELFEPGWGQYLRDNWIPEYHTRCFYNYVWGHGENNEPQKEFIYNKIHGKGFKWEYPVHEVVIPDSNAVEVVLHAEDNICLHHWQDKEKERNSYFDLLKLAIEEKPTDHHMRLLYARELMNLKRNSEALMFLLDNLKQPGVDKAYEGLIMLQNIYYTASACFELQDYDECLWYSQQFIKIDATYREPYFLMARAYLSMGLYTLAEATVSAALKHSTRKRNWVETDCSWYLEEHLLLTDIYMKIKQYDNALDHIKEALKYMPENITLLKQYIRCLEYKNKN